MITTSLLLSLSSLFLPSVLHPYSHLNLSKQQRRSRRKPIMRTTATTAATAKTANEENHC